MLRMVLLRHEPVGFGRADAVGWHYDWMIERRAGKDPEERALLTFRVDRDPVMAVAGPLKAIRVGDHRRRYLTYEGEIGGGRGSVVRVWQGEVLLVEEVSGGGGDRMMAIHGRLADVDYRWLGRRRAEDEWQFLARLLA